MARDREIKTGVDAGGQYTLERVLIDFQPSFKLTGTPFLTRDMRLWPRMNIAQNGIIAADRSRVDLAICFVDHCGVEFTIAIYDGEDDSLLRAKYSRHYFPFANDIRESRCPAKDRTLLFTGRNIAEGLLHVNERINTACCAAENQDVPQSVTQILEHDRTVLGCVVRISGSSVSSITGSLSPTFRRFPPSNHRSGTASPGFRSRGENWDRRQVRVVFSVSLVHPRRNRTPWDACPVDQ